MMTTTTLILCILAVPVALFMDFCLDPDRRRARRAKRRTLRRGRVVMRQRQVGGDGSVMVQSQTVRGRGNVVAGGSVQIMIGTDGSTQVAGVIEQGTRK